MVAEVFFVLVVALLRVAFLGVKEVVFSFKAEIMSFCYWY